MKFLIDNNHRRAEGREEGEKRAKIAVAKEMLADKMDINTIAKFTGLPVSEIERLQK